MSVDPGDRTGASAAGGSPVSADRNDSTRGDASVGELVKQLSAQTSALVRQEIELAKAELSEKGKKAAIGGGMFGAAGVLALYAVGALVAGAILALATAVAGWLAAVIVGVVLAAVAGVFALVGKGKVKQAGPPVPEQAVSSMKEDVAVTKQRAQDGRR